MKRAFFLAITFLVLFASCEKEEKPVAPASGQVANASMGSTYETMLYFNVLTNQFVQETPHQPYDLEITNQPNDRHIFLNSSNFMYAKNVGAMAFESVVDTSGNAPWLYDNANGDPSRNAIGQWWDANGNTKNEVYIINRGIKPDGFPIGYKKLQILAASADAFTLRVANLDNTQDTTLTLTKDPDKLRAQFYFETNAIEDIEPFSNDWHLHFTQYTQGLGHEDDTIPYLVRGVLINQSRVTVARMDDEDFNAITRSDVLALDYSQAKNAIGHDWKFFSFDEQAYLTNPNQIYILKEISGNYFKLRFVDYYDDNGEKGNAKFEIEGL